MDTTATDIALQVIGAVLGLGGSGGLVYLVWRLIAHMSRERRSAEKAVTNSQMQLLEATLKQELENSFRTWADEQVVRTRERLEDMLGVLNQAITDLREKQKEYRDEFCNHRTSLDAFRLKYQTEYATLYERVQTILTAVDGFRREIHSVEERIPERLDKMFDRIMDSCRMYIRDQVTKDGKGRENG